MKHALLILMLGATVVSAAEPPECLLEFVSDHHIKVATGGGEIEVTRGEQFVGRIYASTAKVQIDRIWYTVPRNVVMVRDWNVPKTKDH